MTGENGVVGQPFQKIQKKEDKTFTLSPWPQKYAFRLLTLLKDFNRQWQPGIYYIFIK